jgi:putative membrane protein
LSPQLLAPGDSAILSSSHLLNSQGKIIMLIQSLAGLPSFLFYFATAIGLLVLFVAAYIFITPYQEIALIRAGNAAAAAGLGGAILGFVLPLASAIAHSVSLLDMAVWGLVALLIQLLAYGVSRLLLPNLARNIPAGHIASGVFVGILSLAIGILNAACMTY